MKPILTIAIQNSWKQKLFIIFIKRNTSSKSLPFSFTSMKISQKTNFLPRRLRVADDDNQTRQHLQWMMTFFEYCPWLYYFEHFLISTDFRSWTKLKTKPALILDLLSSSIIITIQDQIVSISNTMPMFQMLIGGLTLSLGSLISLNLESDTCVYSPTDNSWRLVSPDTCLVHVTWN